MITSGNPLGIMSYTYMEYSAEDMAKDIQARGFKYVQIDPRQSGILGADLANLARAEEVREAFASRGISIIALSAYFFNLLESDQKKLEHNMGTIERIMELSQVFGAPYVAAETGSLNLANHWRYHPDNDSEKAFSSLLQVVRRLRNKAVEQGCVFLLEGFVNHVLSDVERAQRVVAELGQEGLGFILDPFNYMKAEDLDNQEEALANIFSAIGSLSPLAHAKDAIYTEEGFKTPRSGTGKMNWRLVAEKFAQQTPEIPLLLEHLQPNDIDECLAFVERQFLAVNRAH